MRGLLPPEDLVGQILKSHLQRLQDLPPTQSPASPATPADSTTTGVVRTERPPREPRTDPADHSQKSVRRWVHYSTGRSGAPKSDTCTAATGLDASHRPQETRQKPVGICRSPLSQSGVPLLWHEEACLPEMQVRLGGCRGLESRQEASARMKPRLRRSLRATTPPIARRVAGPWDSAESLSGEPRTRYELRALGFPLGPPRAPSRPLEARLAAARAPTGGPPPPGRGHAQELAGSALLRRPGLGPRGRHPLPERLDPAGRGPAGAQGLPRPHLEP